MKRVFDFLIALIVLMIFLPLMFVIAWLVLCNQGSPVLFRQIRPGKDGKPFKMIKFRSMRDVVDADGNLLPDSERMTTFSSFLRSTSLDELPQFWNVLMGDMSLVGPRPLLMEYLPLYSKKQFRRHEIYPGITGWAQVNGRNGVSWEKRFALDVWYVDHQSFWLDLKILFLTIKKVFVRDGSNAEDEATTRKFTGNQ